MIFPFRNSQPRLKFGRNDPCPCGRLAKYKKCCWGKVNWEALAGGGAGDFRDYVATRYRNRYFLNRIEEVLGLSSPQDMTLKAYKAAFTAEAVRSIHEAVMEIWPPHLDIGRALKGDPDDTSGLYVGIMAVPTCNAA